MTRTLCILTGLILTMCAPLWDHLRRDYESSSDQLAQIRGGNLSFTKQKARCDSEHPTYPVYASCTNSSSTCIRCMRFTDAGLSPAMFDKLSGAVTGPNYPGKQYNGNTTQNCGQTYVGKCVEDAGEPSGFRCSDVKAVGTCYVVASVEDQPH